MGFEALFLFQRIAAHPQDASGKTYTDLWELHRLIGVYLARVTVLPAQVVIQRDLWQGDGGVAAKRAQAQLEQALNHASTAEGTCRCRR